MKPTGGAAERCAVLGRPIAHSLSPLLHRAAYAALGLASWTYEAIDLQAAQLEEFLRAHPAQGVHHRAPAPPSAAAVPGPEWGGRDSTGPCAPSSGAPLGAHGEAPARWAGFSVTMPLKVRALELAASADESALAVGAANTLVPGPDGGWHALNTDVAGMAEALREALAGDAAPDGDQAIVLGGGATAAAALAAVHRLGVGRIEVWVREPGRATALLDVADRLGVHLTIRGIAPVQARPRAGIVVAALPSGVADPVRAARLRGQVLLDVAYDPWPSRLARTWAAAGGTVVSGLSLLLHQAAHQVAAMTGRVAPVEAMRAALEAVRAGGTGIVRGPVRDWGCL